MLNKCKIYSGPGGPGQPGPDARYCPCPGRAGTLPRPVKPIEPVNVDLPPASQPPTEPDLVDVKIPAPPAPVVNLDKQEIVETPEPVQVSSEIPEIQTTSGVESHGDKVTDPPADTVVLLEFQTTPAPIKSAGGNGGYEIPVSVELTTPKPEVSTVDSIEPVKSTVTVEISSSPKTPESSSPVTEVTNTPDVSSSKPIIETSTKSQETEKPKINGYGSPPGISRPIIESSTSPKFIESSSSTIGSPIATNEPSLKPAFESSTPNTETEKPIDIGYGSPPGFKSPISSTSESSISSSELPKVLISSSTPLVSSESSIPNGYGSGKTPSENLSSSTPVVVGSTEAIITSSASNKQASNGPSTEAPIQNGYGSVGNSGTTSGEILSSSTLADNVSTQSSIPSSSSSSNKLAPDGPLNETPPPGIGYGIPASGAPTISTVVPISSSSPSASVSESTSASSIQNTEAQKLAPSIETSTKSNIFVAPSAYGNPATATEGSTKFLISSTEVLATSTVEVLSTESKKLAPDVETTSIPDQSGYGGTGSKSTTDVPDNPVSGSSSSVPTQETQTTHATFATSTDCPEEANSSGATKPVVTSSEATIVGYGPPGINPREKYNVNPVVGDLDTSTAKPVEVSTSKEPASSVPPTDATTFGSADTKLPTATVASQGLTVKFGEPNPASGYGNFVVFPTTVASAKITLDVTTESLFTVAAASTQMVSESSSSIQAETSAKTTTPASVFPAESIGSGIVSDLDKASKQLNPNNYGFNPDLVSESNNASTQKPAIETSSKFELKMTSSIPNQIGSEIVAEIDKTAKILNKSNPESSTKEPLTISVTETSTQVDITKSTIAASIFPAESVGSGIVSDIEKASKESGNKNLNGYGGAPETVPKQPESSTGGQKGSKIETSTSMDTAKSKSTESSSVSPSELVGSEIVAEVNKAAKILNKSNPGGDKKEPLTISVTETSTQVDITKSTIAASIFPAESVGSGIVSDIDKASKESGNKNLNGYGGAPETVPKQPESSTGGQKGSKIETSTSMDTEKSKSTESSSVSPSDSIGSEIMAEIKKAAKILNNTDDTPQKNSSPAPIELSTVISYSTSGSAVGSSTPVSVFPAESIGSGIVSDLEKASSKIEVQPGYGNPPKVETSSTSTVTEPITPGSTSSATSASSAIEISSSSPLIASSSQPSVTKPEKIDIFAGSYGGGGEANNGKVETSQTSIPLAQSTAKVSVPYKQKKARRNKLKIL